MATTQLNDLISVELARSEEIARRAAASRGPNTAAQLAEMASAPKPRSNMLRFSPEVVAAAHRLSVVMGKDQHVAHGIRVATMQTLETLQALTARERAVLKQIGR